MIATSETKDFVAWFRAYCDLKPTMGAQDGEKLASIMVEKVRTEGFVGTLMQEQTFQDFLDEKEFAKAVVELFASAIATGGVVGMGGGLGK